MTTVAGWVSEELRRAALVALGQHADARAVDALRHAVLEVTLEAAHWQGSTGPVNAHGVTMGLDAKRLGRLRAAPAAVDGLCAALAAAIARRPGETLLELSLRWKPSAGVMAAGYRDAPAPPTSMREALVEYLDAVGDQSLARVVEAARVEPEFPCIQGEGADHRVTVRLDRAHKGTPKADSHAMRALTRAVRDLLGASAQLEVT